MKKFISTFIVVFLFIIGGMIIIPFIFKNQVEELVCEKIEQKIDADINYDKYSLSILKSFPDFEAIFKNISIVQVDNSPVDTLADVGVFAARINLSALLKKEAVVITNINASDGFFRIVEKDNNRLEVNDSLHNVVIEKNNSGQKKKLPVKFLCHTINISNIDFQYRGAHNNSLLDIHDLNVAMLDENQVLSVAINSPSVNYSVDGADYIASRELNVTTKFLVDYEAKTFDFCDSCSAFNNMPLVIDGGFVLDDDSTLFDIDFSVPDIDFASMLSLIPSSVKKYMKDVNASADVVFSGSVKGACCDAVFPAINADVIIENGSIKYPELPQKIVIEKIEAGINKEQGALNLLTAGISTFNVKIGDDSLVANAIWYNLFSDVLFDINMGGTVDLKSVGKVFPLGDTQMDGLVNIDVATGGRFAALRTNNFNDFSSLGTISLTKFKLKNKKIPQGIRIADARLKLNGECLSIEGLNGYLGHSDFAVSGALNHVFGYLLNDNELTGDLVLKSNFVDANQFMQKTKKTDTSSDVYVQIDSTMLDDKPFSFPTKLHLNFSTVIEHLSFDKMDITNVRGGIELHDQQLKLTNLNMNMVDGSLSASGVVIADGKSTPTVDLSLNALNFDVPTAYNELSIMQKYLPITGKCSGRISSNINLKSELISGMKLDESSIVATGRFSTKKLKLNDASVLKKMKSVLKYQKLNELTVNDFTAYFSIKNSELTIKPFSTKFANQPVSLGGTYDLAGVLNFRVDATVDKELLADDIQGMIDYIPGHEALETIDVGLNISGDAKKPDIDVDSDKIKQQVVRQLRHSSKEELQDAAKNLLRQLFK